MTWQPRFEPALGLLVVFSRIFKSPDVSPLFSAQLDPMLVLLAPVVAWDCFAEEAGIDVGGAT